jgi:molybdopterin-guanine dinucleotide biosynthesis protein A
VGGKCRRLGRDKALEIIGDKSLLERVLSALDCLGDETILVAADKHPLSNPSGHPRLRKTTDIYPEKGPIGGIYTGLTASRTQYNLIVACDMPFLNRRLLQYMIELVKNYDLVIPRVGRLVEPLCAVYSKRCLEPIEYLLRQDNLSVRNLLDLVRVRYVEAEEIDRFDPERMSFLNVNTESDLERAKKMAGDSKLCSA